MLGCCPTGLVAIGGGVGEGQVSFPNLRVERDVYLTGYADGLAEASG